MVLMLTSSIDIAYKKEDRSSMILRPFLDECKAKKEEALNTIMNRFKNEQVTRDEFIAVLVCMILTNTFCRASIS